MFSVVASFFSGAMFHRKIKEDECDCSFRFISLSFFIGFITASPLA